MGKRFLAVAAVLFALTALTWRTAFASAAESTAYALLYIDGELVFQNDAAPKSGKTVLKTYSVDLTAEYEWDSDNSRSNVPWYDERKAFNVVTFADVIRPRSTAFWFTFCSNLQRIDNISNLDTSNVTGMRNMFYSCSALTALDVSSFNTSRVTDMYGMFDHCSALTALDVSGFDTSNVTDMHFMFSECSSLTELDVSGFNTAKVTDMGTMFQSCSNLRALNVSGFNTSNVTNMAWMFNKCSALTALDVSRFNTANVTNMGLMFNECSGLTALDVSGFNTAKTTNMRYMFSECSGLTALDVSGFNTSNVTDMRGMFDRCSGLAALDVSGFRTANVTDMGAMFNTCSSLMTLNVSGFNTANVTAMDFMFNACSSLTALDVSGFNTANVTNMSTMFQVCSNLKTLDVSNFNTAHVTDMGYMFNACSALTTLNVSGFRTANVTNMYNMFHACSSLTALDVSGFNTANVTNMSYMFSECSGLTELDVSGFDTSNVTNMRAMFDRCSSLEELDVSGFNTSNVTDMGGMFNTCSSLTTLNVSGFNTYNVADMSFMFSKCSSLTALDVSGFRTSNVTNMSTMFQLCASLKTLDVSGFDTSNVTAMDYMFNKCSGLTALDVSRFDTANVTDMLAMFNECASLTALDLSGFDTSNVTATRYMFNQCPSLKTIYASDKFKTEAVTDSADMFKDCAALVGGAGTKYAGAHVDKAYARIDGGTSAPGYFTDKNAPMSYSVTFDANGGSVSQSSKSVANGAAYGALPMPTRNGYVFDGWFTAASGGTQVIASTTVSLSANQTLYAHWTPSGYSVTFNANGGSVSQSSKSVANGGTYGTLPTPTRDGYTFDGWFTASVGGTQVTASSTVNLSANQTLYAHWTPTTPGATPTTVSQPSIGNSNVIGGVRITLSCNTPGATIYYTTNGADPDASSFRYSSPFRLEESCRLKAVAILNGVRSSVKSSYFDVPKAETPVPTPNPNSGQFPSGTLVSLRTDTDGATIYYTTDGSAPSVTTSAKYVGGISLNRDTTIRAIAALPGYRLSDVMEAAYSVRLTEDNVAIVRVGTAEAKEDEDITLPVSIETTENTNVRAFKIVVRYGESLQYEGYNPLRGITRTNMTAGDDKKTYTVSVQLSDIGEFPGGNFFNLRFSVPSGVVDGKIPVAIDTEQTTVTGSANTTSGRQDMTLLYEDGYVDLVNTNNSRVFADAAGNPITSVSQVRSGSELVVTPEAPTGEFRTASVFCAVYDRDGKMVHLQVWEADVSDPLNISMSGRVQIPENVSVREIRVFVLSENLVPLRAPGILG